MNTATSEYPPLLALGWHPMTIGGLRTLCVDQMHSSLTRAKIMDGLEAVLGQLNSSGLKMEIWVDGSFVTKKLNPQDVDFVARVDGADFDSASPQQKQILRWLASDLKSQYKCDTYSFIEYDKSHSLGEVGEWHRAYWLRQFGFSRSVRAKGLPVLTLPYVVMP